MPVWGKKAPPEDHRRFCASCGKPMRWLTWRGNYDRDTGQPQFWRVWACESVGDEGQWGRPSWGGHDYMLHSEALA